MPGSSARSKARRTPTGRRQFENMARRMVGDGGKPNVYFVSDRRGVFLATESFEAAYKTWRSLPRNQDSTLEDRQTGVIASTQRMRLVGGAWEGSEANEPGEYKTFDDAPHFLRRAWRQIT